MKSSSRGGCMKPPRGGPPRGFISGPYEPSEKSSFCWFHGCGCIAEGEFG